ncbi:alpha-galactosidase [Streptomyces coelicoflavus]|uniref:Alpha-galactosidase n=1 Tax=Streptomyces coelicoflavus TaxID=285562 RepID=A0A7K3PF30_9ACTN|nr:NPCBM/NEW2 domain-containing protein [Streptomyces coelicoflavus]NEB08487.1 alpha-galactosidase [Streptomyces coelicoflavus]
MRHLPMRVPRVTGRRALGAITAGLLAAGGLGVSAQAAPAAARTPAPAQAPAASGHEGLALTPPMGFNNWNSTHCRDEFDESMVKGIADLFVERGLKDAGYEYVNLDDCWALPERDADGRLVPDPERFPNGIKAVADYVHSKGLKFGIYTSAGTKTCSSIGFPGALGHEYSDARQFADWGVDYLKYDNCNNQGVDAKQRYTTMRDALAATGRPIVYSICEWGQNKPWEWAGDLGQLWRTTGDISDSWSSMSSIMKANLALAPYARPGGWNDPDMLEVGNGGMTDTEYRTHFSMWSIMAAPLLIGTDLRTAPESAFEILTNDEVIAVDQDPLGKQGEVVSSRDGRWVVSKEMADGSRAVALFNESSRAQRIETTTKAVGLPKARGYTMRDLWKHSDTNTTGTIAATVPAHGTVLLRVEADRKWAQHPPALDVAADGGTVTEAGRTERITSEVTDLGGTAAHSVRVALTGPEGWRITPRSATSARALKPGGTLATDWDVTVPAGSSAGDRDLTLTVGHRTRSGTWLTSTAPVTVRVGVPLPAGESALSDADPLSASNGWGPVERDRSVGESGAGDGGPITIGGATFSKGLGVHAPSSVEYYLGGACTTVTARVGVDDESGDRGSVVFEVWADGTRAVSTGTVTHADAARALSADVSGADVVRLVVTDAGDGMDYDHADWADLRVTCA